MLLMAGALRGGCLIVDMSSKTMAVVAKSGPSWNRPFFKTRVSLWCCADLRICVLTLKSMAGASFCETGILISANPRACRSALTPCEFGCFPCLRNGLWRLSRCLCACFCNGTVAGSTCLARKSQLFALSQLRLRIVGSKRESSTRRALPQLRLQIRKFQAYAKSSRAALARKSQLWSTPARTSQLLGTTLFRKVHSRSFGRKRPNLNVQK